MDGGGTGLTVGEEEGLLDSEVTAMWWWHGDLSVWGWLGMTATMLVFWALVIWGVVILVRRGGSGSPDNPDAEDVLAGRFARGEIDEDEYRQRLAVLRGETSLTGR